jgi:ribonuclease D
MKRDFGFTFDGVFDTMIAAQFLGLPRVGLADLIERWFGHQLDKQWQRHDWAARPLLPEHLDYARGDSHFLPALRDVMIHHLRRVGRLERVMEECAAVQGRRWSARAQDPAAYQRARGAKQLDETGGRVLRALWAYRDGQAREMDRPVFKVIPDEVLVDLAGVRPTTAEGVAARLRRGSPLARRHGEGLARAVAVGLADETPLPAPAPSTQRAPGQLRGPVAERLFGRLKEWRNRRMEEEGLPAVAVLSNGVLTAVARRAPRQVDELAEVEELRSWQRDAFGADLVAVVNEVLAPSEAAAEPRRRRRRGRGRAAAGTGADEAFEPADSRVD